MAAGITATVRLQGNPRVAVQGLQRELQVAGIKAVRASALVVKGETVKSVQGAVGAEQRMSNVGRGKSGGAKLTVGFDVRGTAANPSAFVKARGPWQLIEGGTKPHVIKPRRARSGTRRRVVVTPWGPRAVVLHPGTRGKHPWERGVSAAEPKVQKVYRATLHGAVAKSGWGR